MVKAVKHSTVAQDLKIEYLKEHLENVKRLIAEWVMQLNAPTQLAPQKGVWGWQSVYQPFAEQDPDSNHMLKRHLRSRALWSQHAGWDVKLERIWDLIKQVRIELLEKARPLLENIIQDVLGEKVVTMHTDISTITGERVIIFTLEKAPQIKCEDG